MELKNRFVDARPVSRSMREHRRVDAPLELKSVNADGRFAGYASVFDMVDNQRDMMMRGAFRDSLKDRVHEVKLLWQHEAREPIGYFTAMFEDKHGLYVEGQLLLDIEKAREAYALMKKGVVSGLSIGYSPLRYTTDPDLGIRKLHKVALWEVSLVTFPANEASRVTTFKGMDYTPLNNALGRALSILN